MPTDVTAPSGAGYISADMVASDEAQQMAAPQLVAQTLIRRRSGLWFLLCISFLLSVWASIQIWNFDPAADADTFTVSFAATVWLVLYMASTMRAFGSAYLLATAYILALVLFHFGLIAQDGFGVLKSVDFRGEFGHWMVLGGWYTNLALGCLGLAFAATCLIVRPPPPISQDLAADLSTRNLAKLRNLGVGLCFASLAFLAIGLLQVGNILSYDRLTLFFAAGDIRGVGVFVWTAPSAALVLAVSAQTRSQKLWSYAVGLVTLFIFLLSGNRSMALFPLLVGVVLWVKCGHRVPMVIAAGLALLALLIIPILGTLRTEGRYENLSIETIAKASANAGISSALAELGGSAGTLAITLQAIPANQPYRIGTSYVGYLRTIVPNIGSQTRLSLSPREIMSSSPSYAEGLLRLSPAAWASLEVLGPYEALYQNHGVGYSAVAEPYFNFGYPGVVGFFLLLGSFLARMDCSKLPLKYSWLVFASVFYWPLILTVRNEFGNFTTPASYLAISLGVWLLLRRFTPFALR